jgi:hypothetical protein
MHFVKIYADNNIKLPATLVFHSSAFDFPFNRAYITPERTVIAGGAFVTFKSPSIICVFPIQVPALSRMRDCFLLSHAEIPCLYFH